MKTAFRFLLFTTPSLTFRLWSSENHIVGGGSRSRRTKPITAWERSLNFIRLLPVVITPSVIGWNSGQCEHALWLVYPSASASDSDNLVFTRSPSNVSDGVVSGVERKGNVLILLVIYHLQKSSGKSGWKVNGSRRLGLTKGKFPGATEHLKR